VTAIDLKYRRAATQQFLVNGLGRGLESDAANAMFYSGIQGQDVRKELQVFACGAFLERKAWLQLGEAIGYFVPVGEVLKEDEVKFLSESANLLINYDWPKGYQTYLESLLSKPAEEPALVRRDMNVDDDNRGTMAALFQAALIVSEALVGGTVRSFLLYLIAGHSEVLKDREISAELLFNAMRAASTIRDLIYGHAPENILAGVISYSEYLTAMDNIFEPDRAPESEEETKYLTLQSQLLSRIREIIEWRIPKRGANLDAYYVAVEMFLRMVDRQLKENPARPIGWSRESTESELYRMGHSIFGLPAGPMESYRYGQGEMLKWAEQEGLRKIRFEGEFGSEGI
jgi:hypothetical protein